MEHTVFIPREIKSAALAFTFLNVVFIGSTQLSYTVLLKERTVPVFSKVLEGTVQVASGPSALQ